jgi:hypothetical protein
MKKKKPLPNRSAKSDLKSDEGESEGKRQIPFGHYALAFIDVLNQKDKLREISALPKNDEQRERFIYLLQETFGVINEYRNMFSKFFETPSTYMPSKSLKQRPEQTKTPKRLMRYEIKKQLFSDSMIYYVVLREPSEKLNILSVHNLLSGCAATFLLGLAQRMVCRIGIDVGIASEYFRGEIYGPALYRAYHLESERAQFPRIVVGDEFCNYVVSETNWPGQSIDEMYKRMWVQDCVDWIMTDVDGAQVLDYAGAVTKRIFPKLQNAIAPALKFAFDERQKFEEQGNTKLAERYLKLCNYLAERREQVWK